MTLRQFFLWRYGAFGFTVALLTIAASDARAAYFFVNVADTLTASPSGGTFSAFVNPSINNNGSAAFIAFSSIQPGLGVYTGGTGSLQTVATIATPTPLGGAYGAFNGEPAINSAGVVAFQSDAGLFTGSAGPGPGGVLALPFQTAPGTGGGTFGFPNFALSLSLNNSGTGTFFANVSGGTSDGGIFKSTAGSISGNPTKIALNGEVAPGTSGGVFRMTPSISVSPGINDSGVVSFFANIIGGTGGSGIFTGDGLSVSAVAILGGAAPTGGTFTFFTSQAAPRINGNGRVAFEGGTSAGASGLFTVGPGPGIDLAAVIGGAAPDGGIFGAFDGININAGGRVAFYANLFGEPGATFGIFTGGPGGTQRVIREGDSLFGSLVAGLNLGTFSNGFNDAGQVAFGYTLADGRSGIAIASLSGSASSAPEPDTLAFVTTSALLFCGIIGRRRTR